VKHEKRAATARQLLSGLGSDSVDPLLAAVDSDDAVVRREALTAVGSILSRVWGTAGPMGGFAPGGGEYGGRAAPGMAAEMEGMGMGGYGGGGGNLTSALVQEGDRYALSDQAKRLIAAATKATRDDDVGVRRAAVALLHHLAPVTAMTNQLDAVLPTIIAAMKDDDADVRGAAAWSITAVGPLAGGATDALTAATKDEQYEVRYAALSALKSMGPHARSATPAVIAAIKDPHPQVRAAAAEALGALQRPMPATQPGQAAHGVQH
jgi:HEAT repeat protein